MDFREEKPPERLLDSAIDGGCGSFILEFARECQSKEEQ